MTTIAYKDGVIAGDTICSRGATLISGVTKVARGDDGRLGGAAGRAGFCGQWLSWIRGDLLEPPEPKSDENDCDAGLVIWPDGRIEVHEQAGKFTIDTPYYAMGSGRDQALGAMFVGASADDAVRASIAHDAWTGGDVVVMRRDPI